MRIDGWEQRLHDVIAWHKQQPFVWGRTDCAMLWRHCVQVCTGHDPIADLMPWYSRRSAIRSLRRAGYDTAIDLVRERFNEIPVARAGRGDVGMVPSADGLTAPAIILGAEIITRSEQGIVVLSAADLATAFAI